MEMFYKPNDKIIVYKLNTTIDIGEGTSTAEFADDEIFKHMNKIYSLGVHITNKDIISTHGHNIVNSYVKWDPLKLPYTFYTTVDLSSDIYWEYINIPDTVESNTLYDGIGDIPYVFVVNTMSSGPIFDMDTLIEQQGIECNETLIVNPNINFYNKSHKFYDIANTFVNKPILSYKKTIENASSIIITPSSFFCFAIQLDIVTDECYYVSFHDYAHIFDHDKSKKEFTMISL